MKEKVEFRVDGYTLIDEIELDYDPATESGTAYISHVAGSVRGCYELLFEFNGFWSLVDMCMLLLHKSRFEVTDYYELMRHDLSPVWMYRL